MIRFVQSFGLVLLLLGLGKISVASAEPAPLEIATRSLRQWYAMGGNTMHGLAFCSVVAVALILERSLALRRSRFLPVRLSQDLRKAIEVGNRNEIKAIAERDQSALARLARLALQAPEAKERVESMGNALAHEAHRNLPLLAAVGNLATMLGLLGTVLGMIEAFEVISVSGSGNASLVAGGIFRALVTTAAGLCVGIGTLSAHAIFARRASDFTVGLGTIITELMQNVSPHARSSRTSTIPASPSFEEEDPWCIS